MASNNKMALQLLIMWSIISVIFLKSLASSSSHSNLQVGRSMCKSTPYPDVCFDSIKLSISINISPNILNFLLQSLQSAISESVKLSTLLSGHINIFEKQKGTIQDCKELHQITASALEKSLSRINAAKGAGVGSKKLLADARAFLSAALTNKNTCMEGLDSASGSSKLVLVNSLSSTYKHVSNALSMIHEPKHQAMKQENHGRRLLLASKPSWLSRNVKRILLDDDDGGGGDEDDDNDKDDPTNALTVAADGSGNFTTITDAINFAPNNSADKILIYVREGVYQENVEIPSYKTNIVLLGDGSDVTTITGNRSVVDGWTTFRSATVAVSGDGFLARDITFENTAGPEKHQAVALRINADLSAIYKCTISGYQDTLYTHSFRQFYRECDIYGTIDYIFGNAAVVFQGCNLVSRLPMPGQFTVITAQSRDSPNEDTGISIQNCSILATEELFHSYNSSSTGKVVKSYIGRPWRNYSRTVVMESYIDEFIDSKGWTEWSGDQGLETLYYGEYDNSGPSSVIDSRVDWVGYHVMDYYEANNFTVSEFITGEEWLDSTSFPYDDGV